MSDVKGRKAPLTTEEWRDIANGREDEETQAKMRPVSAQTCGREIFGMPGSVDVCTLPAGHDGMHRHQPKEAQMDLTDARARLASMATDKGEAWDLSPKDQEAIRLVLVSASASRIDGIRAEREAAKTSGFPALKTDPGRAADAARQAVSLPIPHHAPARGPEEAGTTCPDCTDADTAHDPSCTRLQLDDARRVIASLCAEVARLNTCVRGGAP